MMDALDFTSPTRHVRKSRSPDAHVCRFDTMAERSNVRVRKRTFRTSDADSVYIDQMMAEDGFTSFQAWLEYRIFGRRTAPRAPGPATDQRPLEGLKSA